MDMAFSPEQEMLRQVARDFLTRQCTSQLVRDLEADPRGYSPDIWKKMADLGWIGLALPEQYGGGGGSFLDLSILLEELGRVCLPSPFFSTVILGALTLTSFGTEEQKKAILPKVCAGEAILTLALTEPNGSWKASGVGLQASGGKAGVYVLNGTKLFVPDANVADWLICLARTNEVENRQEGLTLFLVDRKSQGLKSEALETIGSDKQCALLFDGVEVHEEDIIGTPGRGWEIVDATLQLAALGKCLEMVGGAQKVLDMTVQYAKERIQFGKPIGSFQAIQHHCANMFSDVEGCRLIGYEAACLLSEGQPCRKHIAMAKAWASDSYYRVALLAHRVHGAIGFESEYDLQLYTRRAKAVELAYGDADFHRDKVALELGI